MAEAAHVQQRHRVGRAGGRHVEAVAVLLAGAVVHAVRGFFAGDPGVPRRGASGAVADGAGQRGPRGNELLLPGRKHQVGGAAVAPGVVGDLGRGIAAGAAAALLVVAHQHQLVGVGRHHGHAVVRARGGDAVAHHVAGPAERPIAEARGQLQQRQAGGLVGHRGQRAVVGAVGQLDRMRGARAQHAERQADGGGGGHAAAQEAAAAEAPVRVHVAAGVGTGEGAHHVDVFVTGGHVFSPGNVKGWGKGQRLRRGGGVRPRPAAPGRRPSGRRCPARARQR